MEQQCVYFHTDKELAEAEEILKNEEMQIIISSVSATMRFDQLTEEEIRSYIKGIENEIKKKLKQSTASLAELGLLMKKYGEFKNKTLESLNLFKENPFKISSSTEIVKFGYKIRHLSETLYRLSNQIRYLYDPLGMIFGAEEMGEQIEAPFIRCSFLVARKGNNIVRYMAFKNDPIITITGPNSTDMKSSLEKQF